MQADRNVLELLVAVVHYKTKLHEPRLGVCSNWLARMTPPSESSRFSVSSDVNVKPLDILQ
mgnify:CR=1 FL=1